MCKFCFTSTCHVESYDLGQHFGDYVESYDLHFAAYVESYDLGLYFADYVYSYDFGQHFTDYVESWLRSTIDLGLPLLLSRVHHRRILTQSYCDHEMIQYLIVIHIHVHALYIYIYIY